MMNNYQSQQFWNSINSVIGFTTSIVVMGFMVGMVRPMGKFFEPLHKPEKHLAKPVVKEVIVPGGSHWRCSTCGKELLPGTKVFKSGKEVYCSIPCIKLPEHHSNPVIEKDYLEPPAWAKELVHSAIEWWEEQTQQSVPEPELSWVIGEYRLRTEGRSYIYDNIIAIIEGPDLDDTKITLLHELAHIITRDPGHSDYFWDVAVQLYQWVGFSPSEMFRLEEEWGRGDLERALERKE